MATVLGVDSSTSGCKVELRDADDGTLIGAGRAPHPPTTPPRSEQDPALWERAFHAACAGLGVPDAVSVAGQQHGMVVLDDAGATIRPAKLWNDTEAAADAGWLLTRRSAAEWAEACGSVPVAAFTIAKLSWLHRKEPDAFARVSHLLLPHDWLTWRLTGRFVTDRGDASGTGYWSPAAGAYRPDLLAIIDDGWEPQLPEVLGPGAAAGTWQAAVVGPGTGDNMAAALGLALRPGDVAVSVGTSGTAFAVSERPTADASGAVAGFADAAGRFLPLVCTLNATKVTDAFARLLGVDHAGFDALATDSTDDGGLTLLPYLDGERTPNRPDATGMLSGIRSDVTGAQLARAAVEGVVCGLLDGIDVLAAVGVDVGGRLFLVGGGARSTAYRRILATLAQRPVVVAGDDELVARGAAMQAAAVLRGIEPGRIEWPLATEVIDPEPGADPAEVRARYALRRDETGSA